MKTVVNEVTGIKEALIAGKIVSLGETTRKLKNDKETPYRLGTVEIKYPDDTTDVVGAMVYEASMEANEGAFEVGNKIELRVQLEGEYAGYAVMALPSMARVDISKFAGVLEPVAIAEGN